MFGKIKAFLAIHSRIILASRKLEEKLQQMKTKKERLLESASSYLSQEDLEIYIKDDPELKQLNDRIEEIEQQLAESDDLDIEVVDQVGGNYTHYKTSKVLASKEYIGKALDVKGKWRKVWEDNRYRYTWDQKTPEVEIFDKKTGGHKGACHKDNENHITGDPDDRRMLWGTLKRI